MSRPQSRSGWRGELDQIFDSCQTIITDASTIMERTELSHGKPKPIRVSKLLSAEVRSKRQAQLIWYYDTFSVICVAHCVYLIALEEIDLEEYEEIKCKPKKRAIGDKSDTQRRRQRLSEGEPANIKIEEIVEESPGMNDYRRGSESRILFMLASIPDGRNFTYQILRTVQKDDIELDEILTSIIHSGYRWDLGANLTWAGTTSSMNCKVGKLTANSMFVRQCGHQEANIEKSLDKIESARKILKSGQHVKNDDARTQVAIEEKVTAIERVMEDVRHCQAAMNQDKLMELLAKFESAGI